MNALMPISPMNATNPIITAPPHHPAPFERHTP